MIIYIYIDEIANLINLKELYVSKMNLKLLPVRQLAKLRLLESVDCSGISLASPPFEVFLNLLNIYIYIYI